ncbi:DNA-damage-inducible protein J [Campylobacterota bacterium]|nr:DNA-damage-inducible protein J [Campylobacterota bacterium]
MAQVNIRIDDTLKCESERLFGLLGLNLTTAFNIFLKQAVREQRIPFEITAKAHDPFWSETNISHLRKSIKQLAEGKVVVKTMDELLEMER